MNVFKVVQSPRGPRLLNIEAEVSTNFAMSGLGANMHGKQIAIAVGSRGIANIPIIVKSVIECVKASGGTPFIVPAMGSHGGGTAEGQVALLASLGVTPELGAEIRASMDVAEIGRTTHDGPVFLDKNAWESDGIILVNRIKAHPTFDGPFESGLFKMLGIGLGKLRGAKLYHRAMAALDFETVIGAVARTVIGTGKIIGAIAVLENGSNETAAVEAIKACSIEEKEAQLLKLSKSWMLGLPFEDIDLLVIDEIGKEISGTGMDLGIVGRKTNFPKVGRIYIRGLSVATAGNASGIGAADFCHKRVLDQIDYQKTYTNCLASGFPEKAKMPMWFESDKKCLDAVKSMMGKDELKILWIKNTLKIEEMWASEALWGAGVGCEPMIDLDMMLDTNQ